MAEIWRSCPSYNKYEASNIGRVRKNERVLKPSKDKYGYMRLHLSINKKSVMKRVHQLVADAWIENKEGRKYINHLNGNKTDNRAENLEWCTFSENMKHGHSSGLFNALKGESNHMTNIGSKDVLDIRNTYNLGCVTQQEIADAWNIGRTTVRSIVNRRTWKHI